MVIPLPLGLSGCVTAPTTSYPDSAMRLSAAAAKSGVPINKTFT